MSTWTSYSASCQGLMHRLGWFNLKLRDFVDSLAFLADLVDPVQTTETLLVMGPVDLYLGTLLASNANYLVTGDKDLLALANLYPIALILLIFGNYMGSGRRQIKREHCKLQTGKDFPRVVIRRMRCSFIRRITARP